MCIVVASLMVCALPEGTTISTVAALGLLGYFVSLLLGLFL
jgi:hypothetical protein